MTCVSVPVLVMVCVGVLGWVILSGRQSWLVSDMLMCLKCSSLVPLAIAIGFGTVTCTFLKCL